MMKLLMKDLQIQRRFIFLGFVFIGFFFFLLGAFEGLPLAVPAALFSHFLIVLASKSDEKNNNSRLLASFPLRRKDIVTSKYIGIFMFMAISFFITTLWRWVTGFFLPANELPWFSVQSVVISILILLLFYSIYFPIFFMTGSRLVQVLDLIVILTIGGLIILGLRILEWIDINISFILSDLLRYNVISLSFWLSTICLMLIIMSWVLSIFVYERRNI
ncbi:ABC-2 transporter permease [Cytobacillus sp. Hm23]